MHDCLQCLVNYTLPRRKSARKEQKAKVKPNELYEMNGNFHESSTHTSKVTSRTDQFFATVKKTNVDVGQEIGSSEDMVQNVLYENTIVR